MTRKYRQQGYQSLGDDSRRENRPAARQELTTEEKIQRRSLRHATAREANEVIRCHHCGCNVQNFGTIDPRTACPHCNARLHCCRTCLHFDSGARWQCRAEIPLAIADKSSANECDVYGPRIVLDTTGRRSGGAMPSSDDPKAQFDNLFKR